MYRYTPSLAGAIVSLLIFLLMALVHLTQFLTSRNRIIIFIVIGAFCTSSSSSSFQLCTPRIKYQEKAQVSKEA